MRTKVIECNSSLIGILAIEKNEGFLNFVTPYKPMNGKGVIGDFHDEVNTITKNAKEYCKANGIRLVQY